MKSPQDGAYQKGCAAAWNGQSYKTNPYPAGSADALAWAQGWDASQEYIRRAKAT